MSQIAHQPAPSLREQLSEQEQAALWAALDELTDPEIPVVTLREMGILRALRRGADGRVEVVITPTYSGCPAMDQIADDITATLARQGVAGRVVTQLAPAWTTDWMTPAAREKLRDYGIAPPCTIAPGAAVPIRFAARRVETVPCPRCSSAHTERLSAFGSTACKALYRCLDCREPFEYFKPI